MTHVIAIANHKGGVGKTTTAVNIAAGLTKRGYSVLLVDMDAQANLTDTLRVNAEPSIYEMLKGTAKATPVEVTERLHILPSALDLAAAEVELSTAIGREALLKDVLQPLKPQYNYVIIDSAPSLGLLTINAMAAADAVIIPLQAEYFALKGINGLLNVITNVKRINKALKVGGVIVTQYDTRTTLHKQVTDAIRAQFAINMFQTPVRNCIAIAEAQAKGKDIFTYAPESAGADDYNKIVDEFVKRFSI